MRIRNLLELLRNRYLLFRDKGGLTLSHMKDMVDAVPYPYANEYFESDSADGFAFFGCARQMLGLDTGYCREAVRKRGYTLNAGQLIKATNIAVPATNRYVYTIWPCVEFFHAGGDRETVRKLMDVVEEIGTYNNGMVRYCSHEIDYVVPNVTSACALLYALTDRTDRVLPLVDLLRSRQIDGNWRYEIYSTGKPCGMEDSYHLAMMIYHLRQVQTVCGIRTADIIERAMPRLHELNSAYLQAGSIGWGIPMLYIASRGLDEGLSRKALHTLMGMKGLRHRNFRVRAITAWALAKGHALQGSA
ncbi:MAG TPA: hypothetical protein PKO27_15970 [Deltaproteobacteria bacterium]|nr:hypothetical protein [Deltaproteobacteria bacterium]HPA08493.1 hypothetical protein [Methanoregulaceae archaeon]